MVLRLWYLSLGGTQCYWNYMISVFRRCCAQVQCSDVQCWSWRHAARLPWYHLTQIRKAHVSTPINTVLHRTKHSIYILCLVRCNTVLIGVLTWAFLIWVRSVFITIYRDKYSIYIVCQNHGATHVIKTLFISWWIQFYRVINTIFISL